MRIAIYAPPEIVIARPDVLDRFRSRYELHAVIVRGADRLAFDEVRRRDIEAWWLAPGLWGAVTPPEERRARFLSVPGWSDQPVPAYEAHWRMFCPTDPDLPHETASAYAQSVDAMGATGCYCTHARFHHPADIAHLWGCVCTRCQIDMQRFNLTLAEVGGFWARLQTALRARPVRIWGETEALPGEHPLLGWWADLTGSDFPIRWFRWRNDVLRRWTSRWTETYTALMPDSFVTMNCFEPIFAPLVGQAASTVALSQWYSPLLGYWPTHVRQSVVNLGTWCARLGDSPDVVAAVKAVGAILDLSGEREEAAGCIAHELVMGRAIATETRRPYWPVLGGKSDAEAPLQRLLERADRVGADGVVLQGVSQALGDPGLDAWY